MEKRLSQIFKKIGTAPPSPKLSGLILARIEILGQKRLRNKLIFSRLSLAGSLGAFTWTVVEYGNTFLQSDFWILLRLILTDASAVMRNWNDFLFSLLETFPAVSVTIILIPVFAILLSFSAYFKLINQRHYNYI